MFHIENLRTQSLLSLRVKSRKGRQLQDSKNEIRCMDLAYVDILANDNNGVKYLLVRQELFDRTVDAKGKKTKDSKKRLMNFRP